MSRFLPGLILSQLKWQLLARYTSNSHWADADYLCLCVKLCDCAKTHQKSLWWKHNFHSSIGTNTLERASIVMVLFLPLRAAVPDSDEALRNENKYVAHAKLLLESFQRLGDQRNGQAPQNEQCRSAYVRVYRQLCVCMRVCVERLRVSRMYLLAG